MQIIKFAPTLLFLVYSIQLMVLREFTYSSGCIAAILGAVAFLFTYFDTREDMKNLTVKLEESIKENEDKFVELQKKVDESASVLNAVKMQNKMTNKRF